MQVQTPFSVRKLDFPPNLFWTGTESSVLSSILENPHPSLALGQFAIIDEDLRFAHLCRDRIGLNKLFPVPPELLDSEDVQRTLNLSLQPILVTGRHRA